MEFSRWTLSGTRDAHLVPAMARIGTAFFVIGLLSSLPTVAFGNPADLLAGAADATDPEIDATIAVASVVVDADGRASVDIAFTVGSTSVVGL